MREIKSKIIGKLIQDERFEDWWESQPVKIPFFEDKALKVIFINFLPKKDEKFVSEADTAFKKFLQLTKADRLKLSDVVHKNCMDFLNAVGYDEDDEPLWSIKDKNKIWEFVYPEQIHVTREHSENNKIDIRLVCECEWEVEHGLQITFNQGNQLIDIGPQG